MKKKVFPILTLFLSSIFFLAASTMEKQVLRLDNCYHCGTVSACENGGQAYGWTNCLYQPQNDPPDNCLVYGSSECGGSDPGEG